MKILSLIFSPKSDNSITYHYYKYVDYLLKKESRNSIETIMIAKEINKFTSDKDYRKKIAKSLNSSDIIFIVSPVYAYLFPPDVKLFFEKISQDQNNNFLKGKFVYGVISSARIHDYMTVKDFNGLCEKFGAEDKASIVFDMEFSKNKNLKENIEKFVDYINFIYNLKGKLTVLPGKINEKIAILTDSEKENQMITTIKKYLQNEPEIINLNNKKINFCRGELACMLGNCIYYNDDFQSIYDKLTEANIVIINYSDPLISSSMRSFFSRAFSIGQHHESLPKKQLIAITNGDSSLIKEWGINYSQMQSSNLIGFLSEKSSVSDILKTLSKAEWCAKNNYIPPETSLKTASYEIFYKFILKNGFALPKDINDLKNKKDKKFTILMYSLINKFWKLKFAKKFLLKNILPMLTTEHKKWLKTL